MKQHLAICATILCAQTLHAQETRGQIFGRVGDQSGAAVVGASIAITNVDINTTTKLSSNSTGYYEANLLLPGNYQVSVEAPGFKRSVRTGLSVQVGSKVETSVDL